MICPANAGFKYLVITLEDGKISALYDGIYCYFVSLIRTFYYKYRAPQGCVQYFMEPTGTFQSYAYQNSQMLVNQQYATCFRKNLGNRYTFKLYIFMGHKSYI